MKTRISTWNNFMKLLVYSIFAASATTLGLVSPVLGMETKKVNLYALVVGLEKYKDPSISQTPMASAASQLYDFLVERRDLFANVKIALLVNERATKANIVEVLSKGLSEASKEDVVLIFMNAHGATSDAEPGKFYFTPYDRDPKDPATRLQVNDKKLFENIKSEKLLFATGSCYSGGFLTGLRGAKGLPELDFMGLLGRFGISAAKEDEPSWNTGKYGMDVFGFYFIKGLRGSADLTKDGKISVKELYQYLSAEVPKETKGIQHPQLFVAKGNPDTTIYSVPTYAKELKIEVKFFYETEDKQTKLLTDDTVLKSGQHVGVGFKADSDCYVHILWWDSSGQVGRLYPNPKLTKGTGHVQAGQAYWLPLQEGGQHWYVLDDRPGYETIYFLASRERNPKLERLYEELQSLSAQGQAGAPGAKVVEELEREINLMGFADHTVAKAAAGSTYENRESLFRELESKIRISGAEAVFKLRFKHVNP